MCHRHFFRKISDNRECIQTNCNDRRNSFHFACCQWYSYNNPQFGYGTLTSIQILVQININTNFQICLFLNLYK